MFATFELMPAVTSPQFPKRFVMAYSAHYSLPPPRVRTTNSQKRSSATPAPSPQFKALLLSSRRVASFSTQCTLPTFMLEGTLEAWSTVHTKMCSGSLKLPLIDGALRLPDSCKRPDFDF